MNKTWLVFLEIFVLTLPPMLFGTGCGFPAVSVPAIELPAFTTTEWIVGILVLGALVLYFVTAFKMWEFKRAARREVAYKYQSPPVKFKRTKYDEDEPALDEPAKKERTPEEKEKDRKILKEILSVPSMKVHSGDLSDEDAKKLLDDGKKLLDEGAKMMNGVFGQFGQMAGLAGVGSHSSSAFMSLMRATGGMLRPVNKKPKMTVTEFAANYPQVRGWQQQRDVIRDLSGTLHVGALGPLVVHVAPGTGAAEVVEIMKALRALMPGVYTISVITPENESDDENLVAAAI